MSTPLEHRAQHRDVIAQLKRLANLHEGRRLVVTLNMPEDWTQQEVLEALRERFLADDVELRAVTGPGHFRILRYAFDT